MRIHLPFVLVLGASLLCACPGPELPDDCTTSQPAPIANAGEDQQVMPGASIILNGSASTSSAGTLRSFRWSFISLPAGSRATLSNSNAVNPTFTTDVAGNYVVSLVVGNGCRESSPDTVTVKAGSASGNLQPVARPGASRTVPSRKPVTLDGSESSDPDRDSLTFSWSFTSVPSGSLAVLSNPIAVRPTFTPDQDGDYVLQLVVSDGRLDSLPASITLTAQNRVPVANAGVDLAAVQGTSVSLQGLGTDENGDTLTYSWTLAQKPTGSATGLSAANTATPSFVPDLEGDYQFSLVVHDGRSPSPADTVLVKVYRPIQALAHRVLDAEYSKALDRLVMVSTNPDALYIYNPATKTELSVTLPTAPTSVSVGPDGKFAAVGHNAYISYVDLTTPKLLKTAAVTTDVLDVVLAGNGYAYAFPRTDQWEEIHCLNLSTDKETLSSGWSIYAGTKARLHPGGTAIYGANNGLSPSDIEKYGITNGTAQRLYDSPYHGDHAMCGDLWFSEDGARIFTRCGNTFRASSVQSEDMIYAGKLPDVSLIRHLTHSAAANRVALVPDSSYYNGDPSVTTRVQLYTPDFLNFDRSVSLPAFVRDGKGFTGYGRFVFYTAAGDKMLVVLQADASSAMLNDYGIVTY
jgi:hypothetical protein